MVKVVRFHNEFNGAAIMARTFAHTATPGRFWLLVTDNGGSNSPCEFVSGGTPVAVNCNDFEADDPNAGAGSNFFGNLTASVSASGTDLIIQGDITAQRNGQFDRVLMRISSCGNTTAPNACDPNGYIAFSDRILPSPVTLVDGQHALVTVTYTFSAA